VLSNSQSPTPDGKTLADDGSKEVYQLTNSESKIGRDQFRGIATTPLAGWPAANAWRRRPGPKRLRGLWRILVLLEGEAGVRWSEASLRAVLAAPSVVPGKGGTVVPLVNRGCNFA
jgi:hypothetical protein